MFGPPVGMGDIHSMTGVHSTVGSTSTKPFMIMPPAVDDHESQSMYGVWLADYKGGGQVGGLLARGSGSFAILMLAQSNTDPFSLLQNCNATQAYRQQPNLLSITYCGAYHTLLYSNTQT